jgi:site-specific DNA recombinase
MQLLRVALYARVSSGQQVTDATIASQLAALDVRLVQDGVRAVPEHRFVDDGHSGNTLLRPALERLRDAVAAGTVDRLYVHSPDRLARRYACQVVLMEEFRRAGTEVVFLNRAIGTSAEDDLLLQVQGMVAEYERPRSSSAAGGASAMPPSGARSARCPVRLTATATSASATVAGSPGTRSSRRRPGSSG